MTAAVTGRHTSDRAPTAPLTSPVHSTRPPRRQTSSIALSLESPVPTESGISLVAHVIQLSVAPVFLLSAISGMLAVMTNRLSRVIDRARTVKSSLSAASVDTKAAHAELATLARRATLVGQSIALCTITALLVCMVIATLFFAAFFSFDASLPIAVFFVAAMISFFFGLLWFLREIFLATASLRLEGLYQRPSEPMGTAEHR